jgi:hypothetical protein
MKTKKNKTDPKVAIEVFGDDSKPSEFDNVFAAIPEHFMAELCCRHAIEKTPADAIRAAYEEAELFWKLTDSRILPDDFSAALKIHLGLLDKGLDEIAASEKAVAFPMLLRTCRAFPARNENHGTDEGFLDGLSDAAKQTEWNLEQWRKHFSEFGRQEIEAFFMNYAVLTKISKFVVVPNPKKGPRKALKEVEVIEFRVPFNKGLKAFLPGSSHKPTEMRERFRRWLVDDCRGAGAPGQNPSSKSETQITEWAAKEANEQLQQWEKVGFNKQEFRAVADRICRWRIKSKPPEEAPPKKAQAKKSRKGRVRNKASDKRLGSRTLEKVRKKRKRIDRSAA